MTKVLLCMDLMCHKMLRQAHAKSQTRPIERFSYATPSSRQQPMEQLKLVENFWVPNTHIHQTLPAISSPAALNRVIAKLFQFSISRSLPATETVRHRVRAATSLSDQLPPEIDGISSSCPCRPFRSSQNHPLAIQGILVKNSEGPTVQRS